MSWEPDYITLDEFKNYLNIDLDDESDDDELGLFITASSRAVDNHCNRQFGLLTEAEERIYLPWYDYTRGRWVVDIDDLMDIEDFAVSIDADAIDDYNLEPRNARQKNMPYTRLVIGNDSTVTPTCTSDEIAATAPWGWLTVHSPIKVATKLQANRFKSRRKSPYGIAGSPDNGSELRLLQKLDPDVATVLGSKYVRPRKVA